MKLQASSNNCSCCVKITNNKQKPLLSGQIFICLSYNFFLYHWRDMQIWQLLSRSFNIFSPTLFLFYSLTSKRDFYFLALKYSLRSEVQQDFKMPVFACFVSGLFPKILTFPSPQLVYYNIPIQKTCRK